MVLANIYWHIELDSHDILLAQNLPCESYLELDNRSVFEQADAVALHARPDARIFCRPFVDAGSVLDAARARLAREPPIGAATRTGMA